MNRKKLVALPQIAWPVWPLWTLATTTSIVLGFVFSYAILFAVKAVVSDFNEDKWMGYWLVPILAIGVAVLQWLVLRRYVARAGWWVVASLGGWITTTLTAQFITRGFYALWPHATPTDWVFYSFVIILLTFGLMLGAIQWLVLRQHVRGAGLWILANVAGLALTRAMIGVSISSTLDVLVVGAVPGMVTGLVLAWLLRETDTH